MIFAGGEPLPVPTREADEFRLTAEVLREASAEEAEALVYCYPNNPTGATMREEHLEPVAEFAREHDLTVLADEIYADLTYDGDHTSIATLPGMRERTVVFNGFSKAYAMTGLRLGYALAPPEAIEAMNRIHQYGMLSAPTTAQYAALDALEHCEGDVQEMRGSTTAGGDSCSRAFRRWASTVSRPPARSTSSLRARGRMQKRSPRRSSKSAAWRWSPATSSGRAARAIFEFRTRRG